MKFIRRDRCDHTATVPAINLDMFHRSIATALACFTASKHICTSEIPWTIISLNNDFTSTEKNHSLIVVRASICIISCPLSRNEERSFELFSNWRVAMLQFLNCISMSEARGKNVFRECWISL
jgi:hypothetical protein